MLGVSLFPGWYLPDLMDVLRGILRPSDYGRLAGLAMRERVMPRRTAEEMGVGEDFRRTEQMMRNPSVDSVMQVMGRPKPGVFYPGTPLVQEAMTRAEGRATPRQMEQAQQLLGRTRETGMYNPLLGRVAFSKTVAPDREREAALAVASQQARMPDGPLQAYQHGTDAEELFAEAYNYLVESAKTPTTTNADMLNSAIGKRRALRATAYDLLKQPLFANHPINRNFGRRTPQ